jgi:hypothetical protein
VAFLIPWRMENGECDVEESDKNLISRGVQVIDVQNLKFLLDSCVGHAHC